MSKLLKERNWSAFHIEDFYFAKRRETDKGLGCVISAVSVSASLFQKSNTLLLDSRLVKQNQTGKSFHKALKICIVASALCSNRASCYSEFKCICA